MSLLTCLKLGDGARGLVDLGHHAPGVNIEQIIAILLDEGPLGGFHLSNKKYGDDDLMVGTVNPLALFLIFDQIVDATLDSATRETAQKIVYMLDQSPNVEGSIESIIQSVMNTQTAFARALVVDRTRRRAAQAGGDVILANRVIVEAFETDVQPPIKQARGDGSGPRSPARLPRRGLRQKDR